MAARLVEQGVGLDVDTVDDRLSYLVEHGNLARSLREYLQDRARYQLTPRARCPPRCSRASSPGCVGWAASTRPRSPPIPMAWRATSGHHHVAVHEEAVLADLLDALARPDGLR
jgi:hypothetical protein